MQQNHLPGELEAQVAAFVEHYNHQRYHESLNNLTPADAYFGRGQAILLERERIKRQTEPPRVCRRLRTLRGWSHEQEDLEPLFA
jgi:putative transposase